MNVSAELLKLLMPYGIVAVLIAAVLIWVAKQFFGEYVKKSGANAYDRPFWRRAKFRRKLARRYAEAVEQDFTKHAMGFVTDQVIDIDEVYVPLQYELDGERQDIYDNIREHSCSVVIGPAGAGKSLLLKNSMLSWAKRVRSGQSERVPVLVELHRCNGGTGTLTDLVVEELMRSRLDRDGGRIRELVSQALRDGGLSLLFDGLDEVGRADHDRVVGQIRDFAREYADCQFIVTCRDVVYRGQPLGPRFSHVVRVAEFDDAGVIRFLGNWKGLKDASARAEIFASLRKNPALMRLARSPLLLTMIVYLHTEVFAKSGKRLPTSRPAFYQDAITHMLNRDPDLGRKRSVYDAGEKLAVLQRVALTAMETSGDEVDRLTISRKALETTTKNLLPDLNLDHSHIKELLDEIILRSELLVAIDEPRSRYVFRHLTLQEYLTAIELADDPEGLLERYLADPMAWRETVKLWCGANTRDSTKVISEIFGAAEPHHQILALECLAEAKRVDSEYATRIINHFLGQLGRNGPDRAAIIAALGSVAADNRPRGQEVLRRLTFLARSGPAKVDAMHALSASGRPEAAQALAPRGEADDDVRAALRGMGELALPVLTARASEGFLWAVDDLAAVGTPVAAVALTKLLTGNDPKAVRAAWRLAELIRYPNVEEELRQLPLDEQQPSSEYWFLRPFVAGEDPLLRIGERIGALVCQSEAGDVPDDISTIDPRLGIPLVLQTVRDVETPTFWETDIGTLKDRPVPAALAFRPESRIKWAFEQAAGRSGPDEEVEALRQNVAGRCGLSPFQRRVIDLLGWPVQAVLYGTVLSQNRYAASNQVRDGDWLTILVPQRDTRWLWLLCGWLAGVIGIVVSVAGIVRAVLAIFNVWPLGPVLLSYGVIAGLGAVVVLVVTFARDPSEVAESVIGGLMFVALATWLVSLWMGVMTIGDWLSWWVPPALAVLLGVAGACGWVAQRRDRINDNPFRRLWEAETVRVSDRTSVIAC